MPSIIKTPELTQSNATHALVDLSLDYVALCGEGANTRADILFTKRKENTKMPKTFDELVASLKPEEADVVKGHMTATTADKDAEIAKLTQSVTTLTAKVDELSKAQKPEPQEEDILKDVSPAVKALLDAQNVQIQALVKAQQDARANELFEKVKALPVEENALKEVLKAASPATMEILEKAAAAIAVSTHTPVGKDVDPSFVTSGDAAYTVLEKAAKELMKTNAALTFEQAFTEACSADPDTYSKHVKGGK